MARMGTRRVLTAGMAAAMLVSACGGSTASPSAVAPSASTGTPASASAPASASTGASASAVAPSESAAAGTPQKGGTLYLLTQAQQFDQVDPQRAYTGEDMAFFGGTIYRSLEQFQFSSDFSTAAKLSPDLATDTGTATDGGKTWAFTLRDGVTFQDGSAITCADVKYGVSRTFATDVINQGPTYAIQYLDIPSVDGFTKDDKGKAQAGSSSAYGGPYAADLQLYKDNTLATKIPNDTAAYDKAVALSPVPKAADTGETYGQPGHLAVASGPYMVESYQTGNGGKMVLVRNPKWDQASDPYHHAYVDKWEVDFGLDPKVIDQRLIQTSGNDEFAMEYAGVQPENLATIFKDASTPNDQFTGRALSGMDVYARYYWIDVTKVKNVKIRQAMAVALDRSALRKNLGGDFFGDYADGLIKPTVGLDYAPTNLWTSLLGQQIPDTGDAAYAKTLIQQSGEAAPTLTFDFGNTPVAAKNAAIVQSSLQAAGFTIKLNPIESGKYYSVVFGAGHHDFGTAGWGADWPNASTVIPPLLTKKGGWDLSQLDDAAFNAKVSAALAETDRTKQSAEWQALNLEAAKNMWVIPTFFGLTQRLAGDKVGQVYLWGPYSSWPYGDMFVKQ